MQIISLRPQSQMAHLALRPLRHHHLPYKVHLDSSAHLRPLQYLQQVLGLLPQVLVQAQLCSDFRQGCDCPSRSEYDP